MSITIFMPALTPTMSEGNVVRWCKKEGELVKAGEVLAEIETDKAIIEFEAVDEGVLSKILVPEGAQAVPINRPIAVLLEDGESAESSLSVESGAESAVLKPEKSGDGGRIFSDHRATEGGGRILASPLARRLAKEQGLDLARVQGSGHNGRIRRADVESVGAGGVVAESASARAAAAGPAPSIPVEVGSGITEVPLSSMRKVVARRTTEAKQTIPHFYLTIDCEIDKLLALRAEINGRSDKYNLSVNDFVIRAVALALREVPAANASFTDAAIRLYNDVDISVAVATPGGLITPVIRHADHKGLAAVSSEMKSLGAKAREGKLKPEEYEGGGFTISNLGMYGVREFAAIINPPQGCILAVGMGAQRPIVKDGALAIATVMTCTLSVDHRVVDGVIGAEFLNAFKVLIEEPLAMLL